MKGRTGTFGDVPGGGAQPVPAEYSILKESRLEADGGRPALSLFSVVRNEMYFLPHFLRHYRNLGVRDFLFLDDRSSDGTLEYLLAQPDCGVVRASRNFGETYGKKRFGVVVKTLLPRELLQGRWVLSVDADEFLLLPRRYADLDALVRAMQDEGLKAARALMFDFFPDSLCSLENASPASDPFSLCPNFDAWETVDWPDRAIQPARLSTIDGVRPRMFSRLFATSREIRDLSPTYKVASMYKAPLAYWDHDTEALSPHHVNISLSDRIQLGLAHFKFFPGYRERIEEAISTKAYWQDSIEYRFLRVAARELQDWSLTGPRSRRFLSVSGLEQAGLVYSRLAAGAAG